MTYLLDTCVLSEETKRMPNPRVNAWLKQQTALFVSVISLIEIKFGIRKMDPGRRRTRFERWFHSHLLPSVRPGLVEVDEEISLRCADLVAEKPNSEVPDALIAATALAYNLVVATRNIKHFQFGGLSVFNPWEE